MVVEHRQAPTPEEPLYYKLAISEREARLEMIEHQPEVGLVPEAPRAGRADAAGPPVEEQPQDERVLELLGRGARLSQVALRQQLRVRNENLTAVLRELMDSERITREGRGWMLRPDASRESDAEAVAGSPSEQGPEQ